MQRFLELCRFLDSSDRRGIPFLFLITDQFNDNIEDLKPVLADIQSTTDVRVHVMPVVVGPDGSTSGLKDLACSGDGLLLTVPPLTSRFEALSVLYPFTVMSAAPVSAKYNIWSTPTRDDALRVGRPLFTPTTPPTFAGVVGLNVAPSDIFTHASQLPRPVGSTLFVVTISGAAPGTLLLHTGTEPEYRTEYCVTGETLAKAEEDEELAETLLSRMKESVNGHLTLQRKRVNVDGGAKAWSTPYVYEWAAVEETPFVLVLVYPSNPLDVRGRLPLSSLNRLPRCTRCVDSAFFPVLLLDCLTALEVGTSNVSIHVFPCIHVLIIIGFWRFKLRLVTGGPRRRCLTTGSRV